MAGRKEKKLIDRKCGDCKRDVFPSERVLTCAGCKLPFHSNCVDVNKSAFEKMPNKSAWVCLACKKKPDNPPKSNHSPAEPSNREILEAIKELQQSQSFMSDKYDELVEKVDDALEELKVAKCRIDKLEKENAILKKQMNNSNESDTQNKLNCNLIISGVSNDLKDVAEVFKKVSNVVDDKFVATDHIVKIERLFQQSTKDGAKSTKVIDKIPILVKFSSDGSKEGFLKAAKKNKCVYTALECGLANDGDTDALKNAKIIVKEHVDAANMSLLKEAKKLKASGKILFAWFQNSSVLIRKEADSKITKIKSMDDIGKFNIE